MNTNISKKTVVFVILAVAVIVVVSQLWGNKAPSTIPVPPGVSNITAPNVSSPTTQNKIGGTQTGRLSVLSPVAGDKWLINQPHLINWSGSAGVTGGVYLVNASNGTVAGWITPSLGPEQASFEWDTRYLSLSRTDPSKNPVVAGDYVIKIKFDQNKGEISSGRFQIIYPSQVQTGTHSVSIKNFTFNVTALTVTQGDKIVVTNNDSISYNVIVSGVNLTNAVASGGSFTFDTSILSPGNSYNFYSDAYPSLQLKITVQGVSY